MSKAAKKTLEKEPRLKSKSKSNPKIKALKQVDPKAKNSKINNKVIKPLNVKSKDLSNIILLKREVPSRCKSRPKSSLSTTIKKPKEIQFKFNINELIT